MWGRTYRNMQISRNSKTFGITTWTHQQADSNFCLPPGIIHDLGISHALLMNNTVFQEVMLCQMGIRYWHVTEILQTVSNKLPESGDSVSLGQCSQHSKWLMCCYLQESSIPSILRLGNQWRQTHHVHSEHWKPFNQWHSATSQNTPSPHQHCCENLRSCNIIVSYPRMLLIFRHTILLTFAETPVLFSQIVFKKQM